MPLLPQENLEGLDLIVEAIAEAGCAILPLPCFRTSSVLTTSRRADTGKIEIAMDVAASEFWLEDSGDYDLDFKTADNDVSHREYRWHLGCILLMGSGLHSSHDIWVAFFWRCQRCRW